MSAENIFLLWYCCIQFSVPSGCFLEKIRNIPQDSIYIFCKLGNWANDIVGREAGVARIFFIA